MDCIILHMGLHSIAHYCMYAAHYCICAAHYWKCAAHLCCTGCIILHMGCSILHVYYIGYGCTLLHVCCTLLHMFITLHLNCKICSGVDALVLVLAKIISDQNDENRSFLVLISYFLVLGPKNVFFWSLKTDFVKRMMDFHIIKVFLHGFHLF